MSIKVINSGLMTTIQDNGRMGYQASGMQVSGDMDRYSARIANALVGNDADAALLECTYLGPELETSEDVLVAVTGGEKVPDDLFLALAAEVADLAQTVFDLQDFAEAAEGSGIGAHQGVG